MGDLLALRMIKRNATVSKVCPAQTVASQPRTDLRKEKPMKVLRVVFVVALFSGVLAVNGDKGLGVDPNGVHAAASDQGVCIDPNGIRHVAATGDDGIGIDPNGGVRR
jgi:hypothetical protein